MCMIKSVVKICNTLRNVLKFVSDLNRTVTCVSIFSYHTSYLTVYFLFKENFKICFQGTVMHILLL